MADITDALSAANGVQKLVNTTALLKPDDNNTLAHDVLDKCYTVIMKHIHPTNEHKSDRAWGLFQAPSSVVNSERGPEVETTFRKW